jgi:antitoxin component of RelBE/YafQ-DinJ toxin-antitoxin module
MTVRIEKQLRDRFKARCGWYGVSVSSVIEAFMTERVQEWERELAKHTEKKKGS